MITRNNTIVIFVKLLWLASFASPVYSTNIDFKHELEYDGPIAINSGLNALVATLLLTGNSVTWPEIENKIKFGNKLQKSLSLSDFQELVQEFGLWTGGAKFSTFSDTLGRLDDKNIVVLHLGNNEFNGVFFVIGVHHSAFYMISPFSYRSGLSRDDVVGDILGISQQSVVRMLIVSTSPKDLLQEFSQETLSKENSSPDDLLEELPSSTEFTANNFEGGAQKVYVRAAVGESKFTASFSLHNDTGKPLEISGVVGSCSCLLGVTYPKLIGPGESATIRCHFSMDKFDWMHGTHVMVNVSNPLRPHVPITILPDEASRKLKYNFSNIVYDSTANRITMSLITPGADAQFILSEDSHGCCSLKITESKAVKLHGIAFVESIVSLEKNDLQISAWKNPVTVDGSMNAGVAQYKVSCNHN